MLNGDLFAFYDKLGEVREVRDCKNGSKYVYVHTQKRKEKEEEEKEGKDKN